MKRLAIILFYLCTCGLAMASQGHVYALLLSGGRNRLYNHERYWNDCAFLYRTLRQDYQIPKENIVLLMADGNNPSKDMLRDGGTAFASSPTDLDGDGIEDLTMSATLNNLSSVLQNLSGKLTINDHLFVFITDHGERTAAGEVRLWLWDGATLTGQQLATLFSPLQVGSLCILMGQCYAGAFVGNLQGEGHVVMAACNTEELSWACPDRPYDEFVYHWTCAIARHDENGNAIDADQNHDGHVTAEEAFFYASLHDRRPETASITAYPAQLSSQWTLDGGSIESNIAETHHEQNTQPAVFDLQGRRIRGATSSGLYIIGGQLMLKKR